MSKKISPKLEAEILSAYTNELYQKKSAEIIEVDGIFLLKTLGCNETDPRHYISYTPMSLSRQGLLEKLITPSVAYQLYINRKEKIDDQS